LSFSRPYLLGAERRDLDIVRLTDLAIAGKTESYAFWERFREARNCHRVYERQGDQ
jgi:hypothetical protein